VPLEALRPGAQLGRYTIEALLGEGLMGRVYRAFDPRLLRPVAIKVLEAPAESAGEIVAAALREARAAAAILHPNATAVFDAESEGAASFIVMELVPGAPLRSFVGDASVPLGTRVRWLVEVGGALAAAHQAGVVHRHVRPENVMVRDDGLVKVLLDFGVARVPRGRARSLAASLAAEALEAPAYLSPEQIRDEDLDGRADQFGWGVLAYELCAGRLPWEPTDDPITQLAAVFSEPPAPLEADVPPEVAAAVLRALAWSPEDRFPSMLDAIAAIAPFVEPHRPPEGPPSAPVAPVSAGFAEPIAPPVIEAPAPASVRPAAWARTLTSGEVRRALDLRDPDFAAPVDIDAHLARLPPDATCKGLFFLDLIRLGTTAVSPGELACLSGVPERRYVSFRDYPMADNLRLTVAVARAVYLTEPLGEALRRIGRTAFDVVCTSLVGKTLFGGHGRELEPLLFTGPRACKLFLSFGDVAVEKAAPGRFLIHARGLPTFLETHQVGVIEGVLRHCRMRGRVRVALEALDRSTAEIVLL
jgi:uncharacterized protein (TIGR02265 family)